MIEKRYLLSWLQVCHFWCRKQSTFQRHMDHTVHSTSLWVPVQFQHPCKKRENMPVWLSKWVLATTPLSSREKHTQPPARLTPPANFKLALLKLRIVGNVCDPAEKWKHVGLAQQSGFGHNTTSKQERERLSTPGQAAPLQTSNQQYLNYNRRCMLPVFTCFKLFKSQMSSLQKEIIRWASLSVRHRYRAFCSRL
jgi:hypothetical protein